MVIFLASNADESAAPDPTELRFVQWNPALSRHARPLEQHEVRFSSNAGDATPCPLNARAPNCLQRHPSGEEQKCDDFCATQK